MSSPDETSDLRCVSSCVRCSNKVDILTPMIIRPSFRRQRGESDEALASRYGIEKRRDCRFDDCRYTVTLAKVSA